MLKKIFNFSLIALTACSLAQAHLLPEDHWGIYADFLWWYAEEEGLALGQEVLIVREGLNPATGVFAEVRKESKEKIPKFDFDPGFRLGLFFACGDCWDTQFDWTHFYTKASASGESHLSLTVPPGDTYIAFVPFWEALAQNFPDHAHGKWSLKLDLLDWQVGQKYCLSSCFVVRPHLGLRYARVNQNYHVVSNANQTGDFNSASYVYDSVARAQCDYWGIGPRLGLDAELQLLCGLSLTGQAAASIVYGKQDAHARERFLNADPFFFLFDRFEDQVHNADHQNQSRTILDLGIGLKWEHCFETCDYSFPIWLSFSWEHHAFYDFNRFNFDSDSFTNTTQGVFDFGPYANLLNSPKKRGDLFTQGLTLSGGIAF